MRLALIVLLLGAAPALPRDADPEFFSSTVSRAIDSKMSESLAALVKGIEAGQKESWTEFKAYIEWPDLDGEKSLTYSITCSEVSRRDPTFFLRMYLSGDEAAIECGRRAFGYSGQEGQEIILKIYERRLYIADDQAEREVIRRFISKTTKNEKS